MPKYSWDNAQENEYLASLMAKGKTTAWVVKEHRDRYPERTYFQVRRHIDYLMEKQRGQKKASDSVLAGLEKKLAATQAELKDVKRAQSAVVAASMSNEQVVSQVQKVAKASPIVIPKYERGPLIVVEKPHRAVFAEWTDWHNRARVSPEVVHGLNEFNPHRLACRQWDYLDRFCAWLEVYDSEYRLDRLIINLGGDMDNGPIHKGEESNVGDMGWGVVYAGNLISQSIGIIASRFPRLEIQVIAEPGNHTRFSEKPQVEKPRDTLDYLIYAFAQAQIGRQDRITFELQNSWRADFTIYNSRFVCIHGDSIKSASFGFPYYGAWRQVAAIKDQQTMLDEARRALEKDIETLGVRAVFVGHFHTFADFLSVIFFPSPKGVDALGVKNGFQTIEPMQAAVVISPSGRLFETQRFFLHKAGNTHGFTLPELT